MATLKPGTRLRSQVDATEVIVVRAPATDLALTIGGHPAIDQSAAPDPELSADGLGSPALVGKRYTRAEDDLELLVTKAGECALAVDGVPLSVKESKPLPASD